MIPRESLVCIAMQRLHVDDLSGILIEQGWPKLVLPAIAVEAADYADRPRMRSTTGRPGNCCSRTATAPRRSMS